MALALTWAGCDGDGKSPVDDLHPTGSDTGTTAPESGDTGTGAPCVDADGDGWCAGPDDCADDDPAVNPSATDVAGDGVDTNCDGRDGAWAVWLGGQPQWAPTLAAGEAGHAIVAGPDADGDGVPDVIVGAPVELSATYDKVLDGFVTVLRGDGTVVGRRRGPDASQAGMSLSVGGEVTGDGLTPDVAVWSWGEDGFGAVHLINASDLVGDGSLTDVAAGTVVGDTSGLELRETVALSPDLTGDAVVDLIVRASGGELWVFAGPVSGTIGGDEAAAVLIGDPLDIPGVTLITDTDLDGDGSPDLLVSAFGANDRAGKVLGVYTPVSAGVLTDAPVQWDGARPGGDVGSGLAGAGDVDGDGCGDVLVGASLDDRAGEHAGRAYLLSGDAPSGVAEALATATFVSDRAWRLVGSELHAADVDGDGATDVLIGAPDDWYFPEGPGEVWVYRGPVAGTQTRDDAWHVLRGAQHGDVAGFSVATADWDADGRADLAVGAKGDDAAGWNAGRVYLVPGAALE